MNAYTALAIVNTTIILAIVAISVAGLTAGTGWGMLSMLLVFAFMSAKNNKENDNG